MIVPGESSTYVYTEEAEYYKDYQRSYYVITRKKGGWDCMRHYEILANGAIPYFVGIEQCDEETLPLLPKELIKEAMHLRGVLYTQHQVQINLRTFDRERYYEILQQLLDYTRNHLTTRKMAEYLLRSLGYSGRGKVLYLSGALFPDYLRCLTLIGLRECLGEQLIDFPKVPHVYKGYDDTVPRYYPEYGQSLMLYGRGFTYSKILDEISIDRSDIEERIRKKEFAFIIYGSVHRGTPFLELVREIYAPNEIAYLCGEDDHDCAYRDWHNLFLRK